MPSFIVTKSVGMVSFAIGLFLVLGLFIWVRAQIAPGTVTDPHFDPPVDVDITFTLDCVQVGPARWAACPAGFTLVGGGGSCNEGNSDNPSFTPNLATGEYFISCDSAGGNETSHVICCR